MAHEAGPTDLAAHELSDAVHRREMSCREVMAAHLDRIDERNPRALALVNLGDRDALMAQAARLDDRLVAGEDAGWMHGFPLAVKDLAHAVGYPTTFGSPVFRDLRPVEDSLHVARMRAAGAIVIGKTNVPEFGLGSHTFNEVFGTTVNAYDPDRSAGGSSGGAAVALALHMVPVADGSDFGGSLRNPAAWNNVFGFRPSQGRVPAYPSLDGYVAQLSTDGPMARSVRDLALLFDTMAGPDPRAPLALGSEAAVAPQLDRCDPAATRIGWLGDLDGYLPMQAGILDVCASGLRRLEALGVTVEPCPLAYPPDRVWERVWLPWRRWLVAPGVALALAAGGDRSLVKPEALWEYDTAQGLTAADCYAASEERTAFFRHLVTHLFTRYDVLALPSAQVWPFEAAERWPQVIGGRAMDTYHRWMEVVTYATLAGLPVVSVPVGFDERGLPMGMQLVGRPRADTAVLQLAAAYEATAADVLAVRPAPRPTRS